MKLLAGVHIRLIEWLVYASQDCCSSEAVSEEYESVSIYGSLHGNAMVKTWAHDCEVVSSSRPLMSNGYVRGVSSSPCSVRSHLTPVHPAANGDLEQN